MSNLLYRVIDVYFNFVLKFVTLYNKILDKLYFIFKKPNYNKVPKSIGIIPDGNRRFVRKIIGNSSYLSEYYKKIYLESANKLYNIIRFLFNIGVQSITIYCLSYDNFTKRDKQLINFLLNLMKDYLKKFREIKAKIIFYGELHLLPLDIQKELYKIMKETSHYDKELCLLFIYDYRKKPGRGKPIDIVIRTGNEQRLSGFLPLDTTNSTLIFVKKMFPEVGIRDFSCWS